LRTLSFQVSTAGLYEIVLSNESTSVGSYLGIDAVEFLVPEPGGTSTAIGIIGLWLARRRRQQKPVRTIYPRS